jgi:hypothetical protein
LDYPEFLITADYQGVIDEVLCWGRVMAFNPHMRLQIAVVFYIAEYDDPTADPELEGSELVFPLAYIFIGFVVDTAGDMCMAFRILFAPEHDTASGVYFLYAADFISDPADFDPVVRPDCTHGVQWRFVGDDSCVAQPADFYGMDPEWTWDPTMPAMPMPPLHD